LNIYKAYKTLWFRFHIAKKLGSVGRKFIFFNIVFMVFSIISVTTDAILAAAHNHPEKIGLHGQSR
jgi:hypothetical protein